MDKTDIEKSMVIKSFDLFEYLAFGPRNSNSMFQRVMNNVFMGVNYIFVYIVEILVFSESKRSQENSFDSRRKQPSNLGR